jgi:hypothetical protein
MLPGWTGAAYISEGARPAGTNSMTIFARFAAATAIAIAAAAAGPLHAQPATRDVLVANHASHAVLQVYASGVERQGWQDDRLGPPLPPGASRRIHLGPPGAPCLYDFRIVLEDGRSQERHGVDVCSAPTIEITDEVRP